MEGVLQMFDLLLDPSHYEDGARALLRYVRPQWDSKDVHFKVGLSFNLYHVDGLEQSCGNSIANALEL